MSDETGTRRSQAVGLKPDNPFVLIILGILLALTIQSAVEHTFDGLAALENLRSTWVAFAKAPARKLLVASQLVIFSFTLVRFYLGAYRYIEECEGQSILGSAINFIGTFLLFAGFYVASLVIQTINLFYWIVVFFLFIDLAWFWIVSVFLSIPPRLIPIVHIWQLFDVITIIPVAFCMGLLPEYLAQVFSLLLIFGVGIWDLVWLRLFYSNDVDWATKTKWIKKFTRQPA